MTIGIYALYWEEQDLIYIGQSQHIESRFTNHKYLLVKSKHTNYKVQNSYNLYGLPKLVILEICELHECNSKEVLWTKEFDSLQSLNIIEAGLVGYGTNSNSSKYTKLQVLIVFRMLYTADIVDRSYITLVTKVPKAVISSIATGETHIWLKNKYPNSYNKMVKMQKDKAYKSTCIGHTRHIVVVDVNNIEHVVYNINKFALENGLNDSHLRAVINGRRKSHKGWKLKYAGLV